MNEGQSTAPRYFALDGTDRRSGVDLYLAVPSCAFGEVDIVVICGTGRRCLMRHGV